MAAMLDAGPYCELAAARMPIVWDRLVTSARAARFGRVLQLLHHLEDALPGLGPDARVVVEHSRTVWYETSASRATSRMLGLRPPASSVMSVSAFIGASPSRRVTVSMRTVTSLLDIMHDSMPQRW